MRAQQGGLDVLRSLSPRRLATICFSFFTLAALVVWLSNSGYSVKPDAVHSTPPSSIPAPAAVPALVPSGFISTCGNETHAAARSIWLDADARYAHLMDDKFTIAIPTYKRPDVLNLTLSTLLGKKIPSLYEIVIVWNELDKATPEGFVSEHGVKVRYRLSTRNSLNMRLIPDPEYKTQAILQHDDDVWYEPEDLEFVFQTWRQIGRYKVTGALPRCYNRNAGGVLSYGQCREGQDWYALVLTNLAFVHISLMDYYSSDERIPTLIRDHVDEVFNCEDLAINYIASMLTCTGPLHVMGKAHYHNQDPKGGISTTGGHMPKRHNCLNYFEQVIGYFPLVHSMGSIQRGIPHFN
ncbi:glycosyltransferase family 64 protein [Podospora didyma]|uniref:Glycosyltransferase family 64 protein n=1 Tax=Podospora didyma TaxID=330526 RepID=A0AAE0P501_9PEZI|nr:glycosyltransferase family 64 protein [Podospora didyma]